MNVSIDEDYLDENGKIDVDKMEIIKNSASFDALFVVVIVAFW